MSPLCTKTRPRLPPDDTVGTFAATYGETVDFLPPIRALFELQTEICSWAFMGTWQMVSRTEPFVRVHTATNDFVTQTHTCRVDVQALALWL
jgi:hypothetical protein